MSKKLYVTSTLGQDVHYTDYRPGGADLPQKGEGVTIYGGTAVMDSKRLVTPQGVVTSITPEDLEILERNNVFQQHRDNGFVTVSDVNRDPEVTVAGGMEQKDNSAQLTKHDFEEGAAPVSPHDEPEKPGRGRQRA